MNRADLRRLVLEQVDWAPTQSADFVAAVNRLINRALNALVLDAPFLLETDARIVTQADAKNATVAGDRLSVHTGPSGVERHVLSRVQGVAGATAWSLDGTWDGRFIEVTDSAGTVHRRQTREWFTAVVNVTTYECVTLVEPWHNSTDTGMTYRVYTPEYTLPGDVVEIRNAHIWDASLYNLQVINRWAAEQMGALDFQGQSQGRPASLVLGDTLQIMAPSLAPTVAATANPWVGPDPAGQWDYCYTYVWGTANGAERPTPMGLAEVVWESAPSPWSAKLSSATTITVSMADVDAYLGFTGAFSKANRSGFRKRVYARRYANTGVIPTEVPAVPMLLAEVAGNANYTHDGSLYPDPNRRLKPIHGYRKVRIWPHSDGAYEIDLRVLRRPAPLDNDQDVPPVMEDAADVLVQRILAYLYELDGKPDLAGLSEQRYRAALDVLSKRYAAPAYGITPREYGRVSAKPLGVMRSRRVNWTGIT
jgi:hypothetical protein